ncbi:steryl-sulfatase-like [Clytia hemisphaerica]|uniref:Sulfatase N-terminal domain-containing protein n=1 Tax=Clytia hemisphaerica TaxID=252671 RepID=A0A7M5WKU5_9CNID|eukprot:TCONS_00023800-protein
MKMVTPILTILVYFLINNQPIKCNDEEKSSTYSSKKPNFVILYIEHLNEILLDLEGSTDELPNLQKFVNFDGNRFRNVYGEASSASTFASLFTGKPAVNTGIIRGKLLPFTSFPSLASSGGLSTKEPNLASTLKKEGYSTAFYGYWKLGLGPKGINNPLQHGFDTWMGVAYPHNEWCEEQKSVITNQESLLNHPYLKLFYHTSFLWLLLFLFLTMLVWFKVVSVYLYMNLLVYTVSTALAFYILLHLFIVQRSASCVMYRENEIRLQPYDMTNLTLYFTTGASLFLKQVNEPFLMVVNYLKMLPPYVHSPYFSSERTRSPRYYALQELDWSVGYVIEKLEEQDILDDTIVIITGGNSCNWKPTLTDAYQKTSTGFEHVEVKINWDDCFRIPLWIKDIKQTKTSGVQPSEDIDEILPITSLYNTILDAAHVTNINKNNNKSFLKMIRKRDESCPVPKPSFYVDLMTRSALEQFSFTDAKDYNNTDVFSVNMTGLRDQIDEVIMNQSVKTLFHYYNVEKPVMLTFEEGYKIIYYYLDGSKSLRKLSEPIIVDTVPKRFPSNQSELATHLNNILIKSSDMLKAHFQTRQNSNLWSSQFEMPVYPWLLPCHNFPYCRRVWDANDDFRDLFPFGKPRSENLDT